MNYTRGSRPACNPCNPNNPANMRNTGNARGRYRQSEMRSHSGPERMDSGCRPGQPLAMARVPWQTFEDLYSEDRALYAGTLFHQLDLDFKGRRTC